MANKINDFHPDDDLLRIPIHILEDLLKNKFAYMTLPNGQVIKITYEDLLFKEEELKKYMENKEKEKLNIAETGKT